MDCPDGVTIGELRKLLPAGRERLANMLPTCRMAIDDDFASEGDAVGDGQVVYVLPPVSGGAGQPVALRAEVVTRPVRVSEATEHLATGGAGAIATFCGIVRDHSKGRSVKYLDYEAHEALAAKEMHRIATEAITKHELTDAYVIHRIGHLEIGEVAVDIAVSSPHRAESFAGCRYIIEELKKRVPIWKKETDDQGAEWVSQGP